MHVACKKGSFFLNTTLAFQSAVFFHAICANKGNSAFYSVKLLSPIKNLTLKRNAKYDNMFIKALSLFLKFTLLSVVFYVFLIWLNFFFKYCIVFVNDIIFGHLDLIVN